MWFNLADSAPVRDGRFVERIGFYNPGRDREGKDLRIAQDRLAYW